MLFPNAPENAIQFNGVVPTALADPGVSRLEVRLQHSQDARLNYVWGRYGDWIRGRLGCQREDTAILEYPFPLEDVLKDVIFSGTVDYRTKDIAARLRNGWINGFEVPVGAVPFFTLETGSLCDPRELLRDDLAWAISISGPLPVAWHFKNHDTPVVSIIPPLADLGEDTVGGGRPIWVICPLQAVSTVAKLLINCLASLWQCNRKLVHVAGSAPMEFQVTGEEWNDLVLPLSTKRALQADINLLFEREDWFRKRRLPLRRTYLLYGLPGTGKTTLLRTLICSHPMLSAYSVQPTLAVARPNAMVELFARARSGSPALILLDDIDKWLVGHQDRAGEHTGLLPTFLNLLDGLDSQATHGIIIACTANSLNGFPPPLRRPGRFDRIIALTLPNLTLRRSYLYRLSGSILTEEDCNEVAAASGGLSCAHLRECWIRTGSKAASEGVEITRRTLLSTIQLVRREMKSVNQAATGRALGFHATEGEQLIDDDVPF